MGLKIIIPSPKSTQNSGNIVEAERMTNPRRIFPRGISVIVCLIAVAIFACNPQQTNINHLIGALNNTDPQVQTDAMKELLAIGEPAVEPLIHSLLDAKTNDAAVKKALVSIGAPAVEPYIKTFLTGQTPGSMDVLVEIGEPAIEPLLQVVTDPNVSGSEISTVMEALQQIGMPAVEPLIAATKDENPMIRWVAAKTLFDGDCGGASINKPILVCNPPEGDSLKGAKEVVSTLLEDPNPGVRSAAVESIPNLPWMKDLSTGALLSALKDPDPGVRTKAAAGLGAAGDEIAIPELAQALDDSDENVRTEAVTALTGLGKAGIDALVAHFSSEEMDQVKRDYVQIIQKGDSGSIPLLIASLFHEGDATMAGIYLNSGSPWLDGAAGKWAGMNGYMINYSSAGQGSGVKWGTPGQ